MANDLRRRYPASYAQAKREMEQHWYWRVWPGMVCIVGGVMLAVLAVAFLVFWLVP